MIEPDIDAPVVLKVLLQNVHIPISVQIADPRLVTADARGEQLGLELAFAVAIEDPLPAPGPGAGIVHFAGVDVQVPIAIDIADAQRVAVIDPLDEHAFGPLVLVVLVQGQRSHAIARADDDLRPAAFDQIARRRAAETVLRIHRMRLERRALDMLKPIASAHDIQLAIPVEIDLGKSLRMLLAGAELCDQCHRPGLGRVGRDFRQEQLVADIVPEGQLDLAIPVEITEDLIVVGAAHGDDLVPLPGLVGLEIRTRILPPPDFAGLRLRRHQDIQVAVAVEVEEVAACLHPHPGRTILHGVPGPTFGRPAKPRHLLVAGDDKVIHAVIVDIEDQRGDLPSHVRRRDLALHAGKVGPPHAFPLLGDANPGPKTDQDDAGQRQTSNGVSSHGHRVTSFFYGICAASVITLWCGSEHVKPSIVQQEAVEKEVAFQRLVSYDGASLKNTPA